MNLSLTSEQSALAQSLRHLLADRCPPALVRAVKEQRDPACLDALWAALARVDAFGLAVRPDCGGAGGSPFDAGLLFREGGRALCPSLVYQSVLFGLAVDRLGSLEQRRTYLEPLLAGQLRATSAVADPDDGLSCADRLIAEPAPGGWAVSGQLRCADGAAWSELAVVTARAPGGTGGGESLALVVRLRSAGVRARPARFISGDHMSDLDLDRVRVPAADVLAGIPPGPDLDAELAALRHLTIALACMEMTGGGEAVLERTVTHVLTRHQFGRPIGSFRAAWLCGREPQPTAAVARAKMLGGTAYKQLTWSAHQLHGGMGFIRETDLHLWSERAKLTDLQFGSPDIASGWLEAELGLSADASETA
jgi:alkylation response protein AidB-like acyl-CoA dehydrogenase